MLSWNEQAEGFGRRSGSMQRNPYADKFGPSRGSLDSNRSSFDAHGPRNSLVKEGIKFGGWSQHVDNGHLNLQEDPNEEKIVLEAHPVPSLPATALEPPVELPVTVAAHAAPAAEIHVENHTGLAAAPGGWWQLMDESHRNVKEETATDAEKAKCFVPQNVVSSMYKQLDFGSMGTTA